jgi:hypothetical protein
VDSRLFVWVRDFLVGHTQRVGVGEQLAKEATVTSGVPLVYVSDIWRNIDSCIRLFADDCTIYGKITNKNDTEKLQKDLYTLEEWAIENGMKLNPG